jgi:hypothetical protein
MQKYVAGKNIQRYQAMLDKETDPVRRHTLEQLLAEEHSTRAALGDVEKSQPAPSHSKPKT